MQGSIKSHSLEKLNDRIRSDAAVSIVGFLLLTLRRPLQCMQVQVQAHTVCTVCNPRPRHWLVGLQKIFEFNVIRSDGYLGTFSVMNLIIFVNSLVRICMQSVRLTKKI